MQTVALEVRTWQLVDQHTRAIEQVLEDCEQKSWQVELEGVYVMLAPCATKKQAQKTAATENTK